MNNPDWSHGYVTGVSYTESFFRELSPVWLNYVAVLNGACPRTLDQPFTYLDLGCGFGSSSVVNAGAFPRGEFHACDLNPDHIEGGERHAAALGIGNIHFHEASFHHLLSLDLPAFDFIVVHGVYSWVGAEVRQTIRRVIDERVKRGGLVYVSYNCMPGWSIEAPLRRLLLELVATEGGALARRTEDAVRSLQELSGGKLRYFTAHPSSIDAVNLYAAGSSNYLAHEFLNQAWEPFYSIDIADEMAEAGMSYLGSATLVDNHPTLVVDALAAQAVARLATGRQRQLAIDFATNRRFRRDVFVRGDIRLGQGEATRHLHATAIGSLGDPERIGTRAIVPRGEISFQKDFIRDLQSLLLPGSVTIGEAVARLGGVGRDADDITRNLTFLVASGALMPFSKARRQSHTAKARRPANAIVERALAHVIDRGAPNAIPSETLGNGVLVRPAQASALVEWMAGRPPSDNVLEVLLPSMVRLGLIV